MNKDEFWNSWNVEIESEYENVTFTKPKNYKDILWDSIKHLDLDALTEIAEDFQLHYVGGLVSKFTKKNNKTHEKLNEQ